MSLTNRAVLIGVRLGREIDGIRKLEVVGLPDGQKPPIVRAYLHAATRPGTRRRLAWAAEGAPEVDVRRGAAGVPVFRLTARSRERAAVAEA